MPILENGTRRVRFKVGTVIEGWTLTKFRYNNPDAQFGTHLYEFTNHRGTILLSNIYWSGDAMPCMFEGGWLPCPKGLRDFGDRHSKIVYELIPLAK